jgi:nucleoside 2-deoxyribosyltransferase
MKIYLAARYSRREELCKYREQLRQAGYFVDAVWLNGRHQISDNGVPIGDKGVQLVEGDDESTSLESVALSQKFAQEDMRDVIDCDLLIAFTEKPRSGFSRGGRHVELGIAIGFGKPVWIVGPRENIFCWLQDIRQFNDFQECLNFLTN